MDYKLLDHDEYSHEEHLPAQTLQVGDTVILALKGLADYPVTEARLARVVDTDGERFVAELIQPGMMIPVSVGERMTFSLRQAFQPPPYGDETFFGAPEL